MANAKFWFLGKNATPEKPPKPCFTKEVFSRIAEFS